MSNRVFVRPAEGVVLRNPLTGERIPEEGSHVQLNSFWRRRIQEGSLVIAKPAKQQKKQNKGEAV